MLNKLELKIFQYKICYFRCLDLEQNSTFSKHFKKSIQKRIKEKTL